MFFFVCGFSCVKRAHGELEAWQPVFCAVFVFVHCVHWSPRRTARRIAKDHSNGQQKEVQNSYVSSPQIRLKHCSWELRNGTEASWDILIAPEGTYNAPALSCCRASDRSWPLGSSRCLLFSHAWWWKSMTHHFRVGDILKQRTNTNQLATDQGNLWPKSWYFCQQRGHSQSLRSFRLSMNFAQHLGRVSKSAQEKFIQETIEKFKTQCQVNASQGLCSCELGFHKPTCFDEQFPAMIQKLDDMGFDSLRVEKNPPARFNIEKQSPERKRRRKDPQGTSSSCPVCLENRPVVVLMPCGHVVCQQCQASRFRQCPTCCVDVTGATKGLFLAFLPPALPVDGPCQSQCAL